MGTSGEETCDIVERLKKENKAFRNMLSLIAASPRTYPKMCSACNGARMILEEYRVSGGPTAKEWAEIEKCFG